MRTKRTSRRAATQNGSHNHKLILALRESFIKGLFAACVMMTLIGAAAVDSDPVKGMAIFFTSLVIGSVIYVQNIDGGIWK